MLDISFDINEVVCMPDYEPDHMLHQIVDHIYNKSCVN